MRTKILGAFKVSILALILSFGLSFVYAWTAPTQTPPAGNVSAPLNTGSATQTKAGNLTISVTTTSSYFADLANPAFFVQPSGNSKFWNITTAGTTTTNGLKVLNGAGAGRVLTSDAGGNASWQASSVPASGSQTFTTQGAGACPGANCFIVPAGVTKLFVSGIGGGGGGGGGCGGNCALQASSAGSPGSSINGQFMSVTPGQMIPVTIGGGGAGGWGGAGWNGNGATGGPGNPTVFGPISLAGGAGGSYVGYTAACGGACGQSGAGTIYGTGGVGSGGVGTAAQINSGAGGAGGGADWTTGYYGGNGGSGKLIVYW